MDQEYTEVIIKGKAESSTRESDIAEWLREFEGTISKELGLTTLVDF